MVFYAESSKHTNGVAVKIFKRIKEFANRVDYVKGDARFYRMNFEECSKREQVGIW